MQIEGVRKRIETYAHEFKKLGFYCVLEKLLVIKLPHDMLNKMQL